MNTQVTSRSEAKTMTATVSETLTKMAELASGYGFELDGSVLDGFARQAGANAATRFHVWGAIRKEVFGKSDPAPLVEWLKVATSPEVVHILEVAARNTK